MYLYIESYSQTSNISHILLCNKIVDLSDVVCRLLSSPVGAASIPSSFLTEHLA